MSGNNPLTRKEFEARWYLVFLWNKYLGSNTHNNIGKLRMSGAIELSLLPSSRSNTSPTTKSGINILGHFTIPI